MTIAIFNDTISARLAAQTLQAAGVENSLKNESLIGVTMEFIAYGPIELRVRGADQAVARELLGTRAARETDVE